MANAQSPLIITAIGHEGYIFDIPVDGGSIIYEGTLVSQLTATGMAVAYSTASSDVAVGVAQHSQDNLAGADGDKRIRVETKRAYVFPNGLTTDAFSEADLIGIPVYGTDDHTAAKTSGAGARKAVGFFLGMEADGRVRVFVDPAAVRTI